MAIGLALNFMLESKIRIEPEQSRIFAWIYMVAWVPVSLGLILATLRQRRQFDRSPRIEEIRQAETYNDIQRAFKDYFAWTAIFMLALLINQFQIADSPFLSKHAIFWSTIMVGKSCRLILILSVVREILRVTALPGRIKAASSLEP